MRKIAIVSVVVIKLFVLAIFLAAMPGNASAGCVGATQTFEFGDNVTESCTFDGDMVRPAGQAGPGLIIGANNITIDGNGFCLDGLVKNCDPYNPNPDWGIYNLWHDDVTIKDLEIKKFCTGIRLEEISDNLIDCCEIHDNGDQNATGSCDGGIWQEMVDNTTISNCKIHHNESNPETFAPPGGHGIYLCIGVYNLWTGNEIYENNRSGIFTRGKPEHTTISYNYVHDNKFGGIRGQCVAVADHTLEYNYCVNNEGPGIFVGGPDNIIRYNICTENINGTPSGGLPDPAWAKGYGISFDRQATTGELYRNTCCDNEDTDIWVLEHGKIKGYENVCDTTENYSDQGFTGCQYACADGPQADFSAEPESGIAPLSVQFSDESVGVIDSWFWNFGDEGTSDERNPVHIYEYPDQYTVGLTVSGPGGTNTKTKPAYINVTAIYAEFFANKTKGLVPFEVEFTDNSTSLGPDIVGWLWDFGDGETSEDQNATHTYQDTGSYDVSLTVYSSGGSNTKTKKDYIQAKAVIADFSFEPVEGFTDLEVQFTDESLPSGGIESWSWDFGDDTTSTLQDPSHTYILPSDEDVGSYTVTLTVTGGGDSDTQTSDPILVVRKAEANFSAEPRTGDAPLDVQFTNLSTGFITSWLWSFGDGETSPDESPSHTYNYSGNYTVSLEAIQTYWENDTETKQGYILVTGEQEQVATPTFSPASGTTFTDSLAVEISCATSGASIHYTTDGSDPTDSSTLYTGSISITETTTIKAKAFKTGMEPSEVATAVYTKSEEQKVATPTFSPASGTTFTDSLDVAISCATSDASIYYTTDGSDPTESSTLYTGSISITETTTIKAKAFKDDWEPSEVATATFTKTEKQQVATPAFSPASGTTFTDSLDVEISCATSGASIYYTTDGSDPTESSTPYTGSITLTGTTTLKAKAFKDDWEPSEVASATYTSASSSVADFWASPRTGTVPLTVSFRDFSTGEEINNWYWKFGDGKISRMQNPTNTYSQPGSFTVSLTIASPDGNAVKTKRSYIIVTREQGPIFNWPGAKNRK